jgi:hypothetical protein
MKEERYLRFLKNLSDCGEVGPVMGSTEILFRHDVDHDINTAFEMAKMESDMNIFSTYYILHGSKYFNNNCFDIMMKIQDMGHEVGIHNNVLTHCLTFGGDPQVVFNKVYEFFNGIGINQFTTSSHGAKLCREKKYRNYDIFVQCNAGYDKFRNSIEGIPIHMVNLPHYKLSEAYFIPYDYYLSDSGGKWHKWPHGSDEWDGRIRDRPVLDNIFLEIRKHAKVQVNTHPCYWRD